MRRSILNAILLIFLFREGLAHSNSISPKEQWWIDAHPVVHFSIHEKYAPYLHEGKDGKDIGVFQALLTTVSYTHLTLPTNREV